MVENLEINIDNLTIPKWEIESISEEGQYAIDFILSGERVGSIYFQHFGATIYITDLIMPDNYTGKGFGKIIYHSLEDFFQKSGFKFVIGHNAQRVQGYFVNKLGRVLLTGNAQSRVAESLEIPYEAPFNTIKCLDPQANDILIKVVGKYHHQVRTII